MTYGLSRRLPRSFTIVSAVNQQPIPLRMVHYLQRRSAGILHAREDALGGERLVIQVIARDDGRIVGMRAWIWADLHPANRSKCGVD